MVKQVLRTDAIVIKPCRQGPWVSNVETLGIVDSQFSQQIHRRFVAHILGDCLLPEPTGDVDRRTDQQLVGRAGRTGANELAIDLEQVEWKVLQVVETAKACSEVVKRKPTTELCKSRCELLCPWNVGNGSRLRHLQHQVHRIDASLRQCMLNDRQQLWVAR